MSNRRKKNGKKKGSRNNTLVKRVSKLESKVKYVKPEFKYTSVGVYKYDGQTPDAASSFYGDNTGHIKTLSPTIERGVAYNQRIGDSIRLRRLFCQFTVRWPLASLIPNWNARNIAATNNSMLYGSDARMTLPCKISIIRMEHADKAFASFQTYMEGFKRLYTLKENMADNAVKDLKKQELKVLASRSFTLKRSAEWLATSPAPTLAYIAKLQEISINIPLDQELSFLQAPATNNNFQNYRYAYVIQFGHQNDPWITTTKEYCPLVSSKFNYYYTDV